MASIFSKILKGEIPSFKIAENEKFFAILDAFPVAKGHILIIPKAEIDYIFDLADSDLAEINLFSKKVAKAIQAAIPCQRIGVAIIGLEVPHAHIHLIPLNSMEDINFSKPKMKLSQEEMSQIAEEIKKHL